MLNKWTRSLRFPIKPPTLTSLSSLIFSKLSVSSASNLAAATTITPIAQISTDPVHAILSGFRDLGFRQFVSGHYFKDLVLMLNQAQMDDVIQSLSVENADFVVDFYHLLRNEFGFQHSRGSRFVVSHVLARKRRFKDLRLVLNQMLQEEGTGSAPLLCKLLFSSFKSWDSSNVVWDMLAFIYSRFGMVHDALFVLVKMKEQNLRPSIQTYNSLLYNLRHTDIMWDVYNDIKDSGAPQSARTSSIIVDGLCGQSRFQDAVFFLRQNDGKEFAPSVVSFNTIISRSSGSMEEALELTDDMEKQGLQPDMVTYKIIAKGFHLLSLMSGAREIIQKMLTDEKERNISLTKVAYTTMIKAHCVRGDAQRAVKVFHQMVEKGFEVSIKDFSAVINRLCKRCLTNEAKYFFCIMLSDGVTPDQEIFEMMLNAFHRAGHVHSVFELLAVMIKFGLLHD